MAYLESPVGSRLQTSARVCLTPATGYPACVSNVDAVLAAVDEGHIYIAYISEDGIATSIRECPLQLGDSRTITILRLNDIEEVVHSRAALQHARRDSVRAAVTQSSPNSTEETILRGKTIPQLTNTVAGISVASRT